jgi:glycosyltransferase involved in cell wall biosynthesis
VSALAPYKRVDDAVRAANERGMPLTIAGFGPEERRLRALAKGTVRFAGVVSPRELLALYRTSEAVLMPGEEDFGIVPVEAQACGTPVVALGRGGATETVIDGETGVLYREPGVAPLLQAVDRLRATSFETPRLVANAARFSRTAFAGRFLGALSDALRDAGRPDLVEGLPPRIDRIASDVRKR